MKSIGLTLALSLVSLPVLAQAVAQPATPAPIQTAPVAVPPTNPLAVPAIPVAPAVPVVSYQPSNGNLGPHSTCETAAKPTGKTYGENLAGVLASNPGYSLLDQHKVACGKKRALVFVLFTPDGSRPARIHAVEANY